MNRTALTIIGVLAAAFVVMVVFVVFWLPTCMLRGDCNSWSAQAEKCFQVLPQEKRVAFNGDISRGEALSWEAGASQEVKGVESELGRAVLHCFENILLNESLIERKGYFSGKPHPLGQVADLWGGSDLSIDLEVSDNSIEERTLNNFKFGPYAGPQSKVISKWCRANEACVECETPSGESIEDASAITVRLRADASVSRVKMVGVWKNPRQPWEYIDDEGNRWLYVCDN